MATRYYRGEVQDVYPVNSANKGTPGLEIVISIDEAKKGASWEPIDPKTRTVDLWFPEGGDHKWSLLKLRHAGWSGGGLDNVDLIGKRVEVQGKDELYDGETREKFDLPLPPKDGGGGGLNDRSEEAGLTIDAILSSASLEDLDAEPETGDKSQGSLLDEIDSSGGGDDDVPF